MKLTITKYKHLNVGHEGGAFTCDLLIDGTLEAKVENDGNGGGNTYRWINGRDVAQKVQEYVDSLPPVNCYGKLLPPDLDIVVDNLITEFDFNQKVLKRCRKAVVFRLPTDPQYAVREYKVSFTVEVAAQIRKVHPQAIFFNEILAG